MNARVVVVTGAVGGIGTEITKAFEELGDVVVGLDIASGFDVTDPAACRQATREILDRHGRVDVLCNNAGVGAAGDVVSAEPEDWQLVFAVNVLGAAHMTAAVLPSMRAAGSGAIVNTCSIVASVGFADRVVYSASKGALLAMTRAIAADEARRGIRVNSVSPATVDGPWVRRNAGLSSDPEQFLRSMRRRQPLGQLISAGAVARAVTYLADPDLEVSGIDLPVDGGLSGIRLTD
ncbi:SDR family NAD(P)-dependent oxidoreductase [Jiangella endophytica]|uniref:SDR family NAD(P)-dependent oxidoreductase n=1 Tax=Jiangella endophytica TaxID=1623398 RepID=UPI0022B810C2|nr:SDR family oxidoreductase [Jiangella endophytica]